MANQEHLDILKQAAQTRRFVNNNIFLWNTWREDNPSIQVDLAEASLWGHNLWGANLTGAQLTNTNLEHATLVNVDFRGG